MISQAPTIHALLIGIDGYYPTSSYGNLRGCLNDISLAENYLYKQLNVPKQRVWKLISPNLDYDDLSYIRGNGEKPTYKNIVKAFKEITEKAQPGELVYIHYSGHGCMAKTIYPELKGADQTDEGIVPMDIGADDGRYLRDVEIATLLKQMTDRGLVVTVVFDSCHSGDVTRGSVSIRGALSVDNKRRPADSTESLVAQRRELVDNWYQLTEGSDSHMASGGFLSNSKDYILLAACSSSEFAHESNRDRQCHGALTYWLFKTLRNSSVRLTYRMLYEQVSVAIRSDFRDSQTPMLIGDGERAIFDRDNISYQYALSVLEVEQAESVFLKLDSGLAAGLGKGARFSIYPPETTKFSQHKTRTAIAEIEEKPDAEVAWAKVIQFTSDEEIIRGSQAVMLAPPFELVRGVSLISKEEGNTKDQLPTTLFFQQKKALEDIRVAVKDSDWLRLVTNKEGQDDFQVSINRQGEYELSMGHTLDNIRPPQKVNDSQAPSGLIRQLVHLGKYLTVESLKNPQITDLSHYLSAELTPKTELSHDENVRRNSIHGITLKSAKTVTEVNATLRIKNLSTVESIRVVVLNLKSNWEIHPLHLYRTPQKFYEFAPGKERTIGLNLSVPDDSTHNKSLEVIKVFATFGSPDFRWLELPSLGKPISPSISRGLTPHKINELNDPLDVLFAAIGSDSGKPPSVTRAQVIFDSGSDWTVTNIPITVLR